MSMLFALAGFIMLSNEDDIVQVAGIICIIGSLVLYYLEDVRKS